MKREAARDYLEKLHPESEELREDTHAFLTDLAKLAFDLYKAQKLKDRGREGRAIGAGLPAFDRADSKADQG